MVLQVYVCVAWHAEPQTQRCFPSWGLREQRNKGTLLLKVFTRVLQYFLLQLWGALSHLLYKSTISNSFPLERRPLWFPEGCYIPMSGLKLVWSRTIFRWTGDGVCRSTVVCLLSSIVGQCKPHWTSGVIKNLELLSELNRIQCNLVSDWNVIHTNLNNGSNLWWSPQRF